MKELSGIDRANIKRRRCRKATYLTALHMAWLAIVLYLGESKGWRPSLVLSVIMTFGFYIFWLWMNYKAMDKELKGIDL